MVQCANMVTTAKPSINTDRRGHDSRDDSISLATPSGDADGEVRVDEGDGQQDDSIGGAC